MLRSFIILILFVVFLEAMSDVETLQRANRWINSTNKSNQFRAYNDFKNLYLRALIAEDKDLLRKSLHGIVKSGKKLHIDVKEYEKELSQLPKPKHITKTSKQKIKEHKKSQKKIVVKSSNKLKSVKWHNQKLILNFRKKLSQKQVNYFKFYDKKMKVYKYVFEIKASMLSKSQRITKSGVDSIKLIQYNPNTLRLVIKNRTKLKVSFKKQNNNIIISIKNTNQKKELKVIQNYNKFENKTIVIDAGHGGKDPGAVGYRHYREKIIVLQIAKKLRDILKKRGYRVYMTRSRDYFVKLRNRTKFANRKKADLFISIHANAVAKSNANKAEGIECYFLDKSRSSKAKRIAAQENSADMSEMDYYGKESFLNTLNSHNIVASNKLAIDLQRGALASLRKRYKGVKDSGVRPAPFWVLVGAQMPSVLVEVGFITNPKEARRLVNANYQKYMATGLANGIERYFLNN